MGLFRWLADKIEGRATPENPAVSLQDPATWAAEFGTGSTSDAGEQINQSKALSYSPVWQAVTMISGDCSKIPLEVFRRLPEVGPKARVIDCEHDVYGFVSALGRANDETSALQFWRRLFVSALLWNNGFAWIDRDRYGTIHGLYNLLPDRTTTVRSRGRLFYVTEIGHGEAARLEAIPAVDVLHLDGLSWGDVAPDLVKQARHDFGLALSRRKYTSKFFKQGAHHGGVLQIPPGASKAARDKIEKALDERFTLDKAFKTMVLRDGYRWYSTTVDPERSQLTALDDQEIRHVAQWYNLPPERLGLKGSVSYNSLEQSTRFYVDTTLSYWLTACRAECNLKLLTPAEHANREVFIDYNINALLWADAATRNTIACQGIQSGRFSPDETRAWENLNPREDGEGGRYWRPSNFVAVGEEPVEPAETPETPAEEETPPAKEDMPMEEDDPIE